MSVDPPAHQQVLRRRVLKWTLWAVAIAALVFILGHAVWLAATPDYIEHGEEYRLTLQMIEEIETFRGSRGKLPAQEEVTLPSGHHYYLPCDGGYVAGYSMGFDEFCQFHGPDGGWDCLGGGCP